VTFYLAAPRFPRSGFSVKGHNRIGNVQTHGVKCPAGVSRRRGWLLSVCCFSCRRLSEGELEREGAVKLFSQSSRLVENNPRSAMKSYKLVKGVPPRHLSWPEEFLGCASHCELCQTRQGRSPERTR